MYKSIVCTAVCMLVPTRKYSLAYRQHNTTAAVHIHDTAYNTYSSTAAAVHAPERKQQTPCRRQNDESLWTEMYGPFSLNI